MREQFVEHFSEEIAQAIEAAAISHKNGVHYNPGSDMFRWAIIVCIGFECFTQERFAQSHGIDRANEIKPWLKEHAVEWLVAHDGDIDYLALLADSYNEYALVSDTE